MQIRTGYEIVYECPQRTPMVLMLSVHPSRLKDLVTPQQIMFDPPAKLREYRDGYGNVCSRMTAPAGKIKISVDFVIEDEGLPDVKDLTAPQHTIDDLPDDVLVYLLGSRYCETDRLSTIAWDLFGKTPLGAARVKAICDYVHHHIKFGYEHASPFKTAWDVFNERRGVCRDYAHLMVAFCRCMNIPARYCTGYLSDIGVPPPHSAGDFAAWTEVYLGGAWHMYDPRNNVPRQGRILMAQGRDAADVAIITSFGICTMVTFKVITDEIPHFAMV